MNHYLLCFKATIAGEKVEKKLEFWTELPIGSELVFAAKKMITHVFGTWTIEDTVVITVMVRIHD